MIELKMTLPQIDSLSDLESALISDFPSLSACAKQFLIPVGQNGSKERSTAGRACALTAVEALCLALSLDPISKDFDFRKNEYGAPLFPENFIGSISHSKNIAVAIAGQNKHPFRSIGIDVETGFEKAARIVHKIADDSELSSLISETTTKEESSAILFAVKEAFYKAVNVLNGNDNKRMIPSWNNLRCTGMNGNLVSAEFTLENNPSLTFEIRVYKTLTPLPFICSVVVCH